MADIDQRIRTAAFGRLDEQVAFMVMWLSRIEAILHFTIFHGGELKTALLPFDDINEKLMRVLIAPDLGC